MVQTGRVAILLLILLALLVPWVPGGEAQWTGISKYSHDLIVESSPDEPVDPVHDVATIVFSARFHCQGLGPEPGTDGFRVDNTVTIDGASARAHVQPTSYWVPFDRTACLQAMDHEQKITVSVRFPDSARAYSLATVRLDSVPQTDQTVPKTSMAQLKVGFAGGLAAENRGALVVTDAHGFVEHDLPVANHANGDVLVETALAPGHPEAVTFVPPPPTVVSTRLGSDSDGRASLPLVFQAPAATNHTQVYSLTLRIDGVSADVPDVPIDESTYVPLVVVVPAADAFETQSETVFEAPAPVLPGLGLLAALGLAGRRRRS